MGLDLVELLMAIEDEFGVHIDNADAVHLKTPGLVTDYLSSRLRLSSSAPCQTQVGFYKLRAAIANTFGVDKNSIYPNSSLSSFITSDIRKNWRKLQETVGTKFPRLKRSRPLYISTIIVLPAISAYPILAGGSPSFGIITFLFLFALANHATYKLGSVIPPQTITVGQLARYVTCSESSVWHRNEILARVIELTSEQLSVPKNKIHEHSHFIKDLGAG